MGLMTRALSLIVAFACLTSVAQAIAGQATFYGPPYRPTPCFGSEDRGVNLLAANRGLFPNKSACGTRYRVTCTGSTSGILQPCTGRSVDVTVVDLCPGCTENELDITRDAFAIIANTDAGRINIDYNRI